MSDRADIVDNPKDKPLLERVQSTFKEDKTRWEPIWQAGTVDMRFVDGDTLDPTERQLRTSNGRPWFDLDEINQYENQVINDVLANKRGVKFSPIGLGASKETARFYADKMRETEYRSKAAKMAYPTALKNCVWQGFGYVRLKTKFKRPAWGVEQDETAFHQDLWIEQVADPHTILPDSNFQLPDLSDIERLFVLEQYTRDEFEAKFPGAQIKSFSNEMLKNSQGWVTQKSVQVAEFWWIEQVQAFTLALIEDADGNPRVVKAEILKAEGMPQGYELKRERVVEEPKVRQVLTNGVEILERHEWPGVYIPFAGCIGKMFWRDKGSGSERVIHSMTRLARVPATLYSYYATVEGELLRQVPKFPYFYYEGTLSDEMLQTLQRSYDQPVAAIGVKHTVDGASGGPLPFPQRAPFEPPIMALQAGKESARQGIRAAMGLLPLPTDAGRMNEKSGVALREMRSTAQLGAFQFPDALNAMVEHVGVMCEDLFPKILTGEREETVLGEDMQPRTLWINQAQGEGQEGDFLPSIQGFHAVTVSTGPSKASEMEQAKDFVDDLVGSKEMLMIAGPEGAKKVVAKAIKMQNLGPVGDEIANVYDPQDGEETAFPPEAQAIINEGKQIAMALAQENQQLKQALEGKQLEVQSKERVAAAADETKKQIAAMQDQTKREIEELKAATDLQLQRMEDTIKRAELVIKSQQMEQQQDHDREMAREGHAQAMQSQSQSEEASARQAALKPNGAAS